MTADSTGSPTLAWNHLLLDQLTWHWDAQLRPRLEGLTDEEYLWEPSDHCWSVRPRGSSSAPVQAGAGDYDSWTYAGTAAEALHQLDDAVRTWSDGVRSLGEEGLARPCGPAEGPFAEAPMAMLLLHIHRETIHHGSEISLLRDLFRARAA